MKYLVAYELQQLINQKICIYFFLEIDSKLQMTDGAFFWQPRREERIMIFGE